ncbi:hypothetical protein INR49_027421, partial [Caranx melampygus]
YFKFQPLKSFRVWAVSQDSERSRILLDLPYRQMEGDRERESERAITVVMVGRKEEEGEKEERRRRGGKEEERRGGGAMINDNDIEELNDVGHLNHKKYTVCRCKEVKMIMTDSHLQRIQMPTSGIFLTEFEVTLLLGRVCISSVVAKYFMHMYFPKACTQAYTQRCDLPGRAVKRCNVRKHLAKQTEPHKASACSRARPQGRAPHISMRGERRRRRRRGKKERSDETRPDQTGQDRTAGIKKMCRRERGMRQQPSQVTRCGQRWAELSLSTSNMIYQEYNDKQISALVVSFPLTWAPSILSVSMTTHNCPALVMTPVYHKLSPRPDSTECNAAGCCFKPITNKDNATERTNRTGVSHSDKRHRGEAERAAYAYTSVLCSAGGLSQGSLEVLRGDLGLTSNNLWLEPPLVFSFLTLANTNPPINPLPSQPKSEKQKNNRWAVPRRLRLLLAITTVRSQRGADEVRALSRARAALGTCYCSSQAAETSVVPISGMFFFQPWGYLGNQAEGKRAQRQCKLRRRPTHVFYKLQGPSMSQRPVSQPAGQPHCHHHPHTLTGAELHLGNSTEMEMKNLSSELIFVQGQDEGTEKKKKREDKVIELRVEEQADAGLHLVVYPAPSAAMVPYPQLLHQQES